MRESLTIFAVAIILVLSALLVGPYLIDWNGQRDWLAAKLSETVGAQVRIDGPIDVKLLPRPIFQAAAVSMQGAKPGEPRLSAARLDAELSINGLLQGAIEFVDATVTAPRLEVTLREDGSVVAPAWDVDNPQKFQFTHVNLTDGTIAVKDEHGADRLVLTGIRAQGEAETLFGPAKLNGAAQGPQGAFTFRLSTGAFANRRLRARLVVDGAGAVAHADVDGVIAVGAGGSPTPGHAALAFDGAVNLAGSLRVADGAAPVPWTLAAASVAADARSLTVPTLELRAGADGRAFVANGGALVAFGPRPSAAVQLRARQLDLDHIAVAPESAPDTPRPRAGQWLAAAQGLGDSLGTLPVALTLNAGVDAVTTNDLTFTDASAVLSAKQGSAPRAAFTIAGPNGSRLALDGVVEPGPVSAFKGRATFETHDLARASRWIEPFRPGTADWIAAHAPIASVAFDANVEVSRVGLAARDMSLTLDGSAFRGTLSLTDGVGSERPRLFADLAADALDLDRLPELGELAAAASSLDLSLGIAADAVKISRMGSGRVDAGRLSVHLTKTAEATTVDQFSVGDFEGATIRATGSLDAARHLHAQGHAEAKTLLPLAALLGRIAPGALADGLAGRAGVLAPLAFDFTGEGSLDTDGLFVPSVATGTGNAAATRFSLSISPDRTPGRDAGVASAVVMLDAPDGGNLFRQLGLPAAATPLGAGHVEVTARGSPKSGYETTLAASVPAAKLAFGGFVGSGSGRGHVAASGSDVAALMKVAGWVGPSAPAGATWSAESDLAWADGKLDLTKLSSRIAGVAASGALGYATAGAPSMPALTGSLKIDTLSLADLTGLALGASGAPGTAGWSSAAFPLMSAWPRAAVALRFGTLTLLPGIAARDAGLTLTLAPSNLTLGDIAGHVLDGTAGGGVTLRRDGASASLSGQIRFDDLALTLPSLGGRISGALNVAGTGANPEALVGSIAGEGTLRIAGATIPRFDPAALSRVAAAFDQEGATIDDQSVGDVLLKALDRGPLSLGDVATPATLAAGTLRVVGLQVKRPDLTASAEGSFSLRNETLTLRTTLASVALPKDWKGDPPQVTVVWSGPLASPVRAVDDAAFVNGLAARAIARDQERIELMQDDLRERAFFARRLKAIEAEQQAARDAAQAAKIVPLPPRAGDIRVPKVPDVAAPAQTPGLKPFAPPVATGVDPITSLLESSPAAAGKLPLQIGPMVHPPAPVLPSTSPTADPGAVPY